MESAAVLPFPLPLLFCASFTLIEEFCADKGNKDEWLGQCQGLRLMASTLHHISYPQNGRMNCLDWIARKERNKLERIFSQDDRCGRTQCYFFISVIIYPMSKAPRASRALNTIHDV